jgi:hypothetical protein
MLRLRVSECMSLGICVGDRSDGESHSEDGPHQS